MIAPTGGRTALVGVMVELYLRDRLIRGLVSTQGLRALDLFNRTDRALQVREAQAASFHCAATPRFLGSVRVDKAQVLLVAPHDAEHLLWARLRAGWVPKSKVQAEAGVGPLIVRGTFHVGRSIPLAMASVFLGSEQRLFLPVTDATISSEYHRNWSVQLAAVFIPRRLIEYVTLPELGQLAGEADDVDDVSGCADSDCARPELISGGVR
jgi:hypothetical protein